MSNRLNSYECQMLLKSDPKNRLFVTFFFFFTLQVTCWGSWSMSTELECQVQASSGALEDSWRAKVEKRGKWNNWAGIWFIYCVLWGRDRVNDCSALQSEVASEPDSSLFFSFPVAVIKVPFTWHVLPLPFEFLLSRTHYFSSSLMHAYIYNHPPP